MDELVIGLTDDAIDSDVSTTSTLNNGAELALSKKRGAVLAPEYTNQLLIEMPEQQQKSLRRYQKLLASRWLSWQPYEVHFSQPWSREFYVDAMLVCVEHGSQPFARL